jgi:hypothetical protein
VIAMTATDAPEPEATDGEPDKITVEEAVEYDMGQRLWLRCLTQFLVETTFTDGVVADPAHQVLPFAAAVQRSLNLARINACERITRICRSDLKPGDAADDR